MKSFKSIVNYHPEKDDNGKQVPILNPHKPTPSSTWNDEDQVATWTPQSHSPYKDSGIHIPLHTPEQTDPSVNTRGKPLSAGVIIKEGKRVWVVHPTNQFGGYHATFPKGRVEEGEHPRDSAVKEAREESGLHVTLGKHFKDVDRTTSHTRYYEGKRTGGCPSKMGWESQAVSLVPIEKLHEHVTHPNDQAIVKKLQDEHDYDEIRTADFRENKKLDEAMKLSGSYKKLKDTENNKITSNDSILSKHYKIEDEDRIHAIKRYTSASGNHSSPINHYLFRHKSKKLKKLSKCYSHTIKHLDNHLGSIEAPHEFHVYSGLHTTDLKEGKVYKHHGYMSSSLSEHTASSFGISRYDEKEKNKYTHVLKLKIPKGSKHGCYVKPHSEIKSEKEFLINRGKKIKITHIETLSHKFKYSNIGNGYKVYHGEIVE